MGLFHKLFGRRGEASDREILLHILKETHQLVKGQHAMALDLTRLNAAVARVGTDVDTLIAAHADPAGQTAVDAAAAAVEAVAAKAEAAAAPAVVAPAPAA